MPQGSETVLWVAISTSKIKQLLTLFCMTALLEYIGLTMASIGPAIAGSAGPTLMPLH